MVAFTRWLAVLAACLAGTQVSAQENRWAQPAADKALLAVLHARSGPTVNCSAGQTITGAINGLKPSAFYQQISITGACRESVYIPPELAVALVSSTKATLVPPAGFTGPTVNVAGQLFMQGMAVTGTSFTAFNGGIEILSNMLIGGPGTAINISNNAIVVVQTSTIAVTGANAAISTYNQGTLEIDGYSYSSSATGTSISSKGGDGIGCYGGGNIVVNSSGGPVAIQNNGGTAISAVGCTVNLTGKYFIHLVHNKGFAALNMAQASSLTMDHTVIEDNAGVGLYAQVGSGVQFSGSVTIAGNVNSPLQLSSNAVAKIAGYAGGANNISAPASFTNAWYNCYQGGKIYADTLSGVITPAPTSQQLGCLQVGGP